MPTGKKDTLSKVDHRSDVKAVKSKNQKSKDSDNKNENAAHAKSNTGHYQSPKGK